jgi:lipoprotein-anchoring transpeptidase ErfK/SrfK
MKQSRFIVTLSLAMLATLIIANGIASAKPMSDVQPAPNRVIFPAPNADSALPPLTYAWVITANVPVYANPGDFIPVRDLGAGFLYVSVMGQPIVQGGQTWYQINPGEYIDAASVVLIRPSSFHGITLDATPDKPFGWLVYAVQPSISAGTVPTKGVKALTRYTPVTVYEETKVGEVTWYRIGDNQWVDQKKVGLVFPAPRPEGVGPSDKWIDVNTFEQTLAAYEGDRMVYATLVSSGLPQWETDPGLFRVFAKVKLARMSGREGLADYYFLEDVPWATYFNKDMALHGAYWHDKFGFKHSHGCVNLPPADARWIFDWTTPTPGDGNWTVVPDRANNDIGTWVWVHD